MSRTVEKSVSHFSGIFSALLGVPRARYDVRTSFPNFQSSDSHCSTSFGLINFVERLEAARKISKQEEEELLIEEYQTWVKQAAHQSTSSAIISDYLCRSLIAFSRGHYFTNLHINAIKLTQCDRVIHKKLGYLYISRTMNPGSDLSVLLINTILKDLSSSCFITISSGLSLLPIVVSQDIIHMLYNSLLVCFSKQQEHIRRKAVIMAAIVASQSSGHYDSSMAIIVPSLLQLLSDFDPAVAMAAADTLSKIYKVIKDEEIHDNIRDRVAICCANIILQATSGALSSLYNTGPTSAPFVQVKMLKVIQVVSSSKCKVPEIIINAIYSVLSQPWGGRDLTLYMTYIEGITTASCIQKDDGLMNLSLKIILGFLKSLYIDFKYMGIKILSQVYDFVEESLSKSHLEAIFECLYSKSLLLQSRTVHLLCSMANGSNYQYFMDNGFSYKINKTRRCGLGRDVFLGLDGELIQAHVLSPDLDQAICTTLMQLSLHVSSQFKSLSLCTHLANILKRLSIDLTWCISFLTPLMIGNDMKQEFFEALIIAASNAFAQAHSEEDKKNMVFCCNKVFNLFVNYEIMTFQQIKTFAALLNIIFASNVINEVDKSVLNKYLEKLKYKLISEIDNDVIECVLNCGLFVPECKEKVMNILIEMLSIADLYSSLKIKEKISLFNYYEITKNVLVKRVQIIDEDYVPDFSLSFYDSYINNSSEIYKNNFVIYEPTGLQQMPLTSDFSNYQSGLNCPRRTGFKNPFDTFSCSTNISIDQDSVSTSSSTNSIFIDSSDLPNSTKPIEIASKPIWTSKGRVNYDFDMIKTEIIPYDENSTMPINSCIEMAHEANESLMDETKTTVVTSNSLSFMESHKADLTKALMKGLGFSKN